MSTEATQTNTQGSAASAANPSTAATSSSTTATDWTVSLSEEQRGYVQNKGFKDPASVLDSYRNFEKLMGVPQDQILKLPKADDAEGWKGVYKKLGAPEKPDEYKFEGGSPELSKWASENFLNLGLTRKQGESLFSGFSKYAQEMTQAKENEMAAKAAEEEISLKKEWGSNYEQNVKLAKQAAQKYGLSEQVIDSIEKGAGYSGVMKFLSEIGKTTAEDNFVGGNGKGAPARMSPEAARQRINELKADSDFGMKLNAGDVNAKKEWDSLHLIAYSSDKSA